MKATAVQFYYASTLSEASRVDDDFPFPTAAFASIRSSTWNDDPSAPVHARTRASED